MQAVSADGQQSAHLELMFEAAAELFKTEDVDSFIETVSTRLLELLRLQGYFHYRKLDSAAGEMELASYSGVSEDTAAGIRRLKFDEAVCGTVALHGERAVIADVQSSSDPITERIRGLGVTAYACFPIEGSSRLFGTFSFFRRDESDFSAAEISLLQSVCDLIGSAFERHRATQAVRESEARLRRVLKHVPAGVVIADGSGNLLYGNDELERIFQTSLVPTTGPLEYGDWPLYLPDSEEPFPLDRLPLMRSLATGETVTGEELRIRRPDGSWRTLLVSSAAVQDSSGGTALVVAAFIDETDRKRSEEALREAKEEAERASQAKSQFLSTISHELRTPLTAVIGLSDLLGTDVVGPMNEKQRKHLARINSSAWLLVGIIDEILTFTRSEAGKEEVRLERVNVAKVVRDVVDMLRAEAEAKALALRLTGADASVPASTDEAKVRRIVTNLVGNAIKYTREGAVDVELESDGERITLRVRDTGPGVEPDRLEEIFEPFVQVDGSTTRTAGGTGLGLTICRRLAILLGGDVTVESTLGDGSVFTLTIDGGGPR